MNTVVSNLGLTDHNDINIEKFNESKKTMRQSRNHVKIIEHNFDQKISFLERDIYNLQQKLSELNKKD